MEPISTAAGAVRTASMGAYTVVTSLRASEALAMILHDLYGTWGEDGASYGMDGDSYDGEKIDSVETAIKYCKAKLKTKATHVGTASAVSLGVSGVNAAVGGIAGSIVPGAGTAVGAVAGGAIGFGLSKGMEFGWRGAKKAKKFVSGKLGLSAGLGQHRREAAAVLVGTVQNSNAPDRDFLAAERALKIILGAWSYNFYERGGVYGLDYGEFETAVYDALKSW